MEEGCVIRADDCCLNCDRVGELRGVVAKSAARRDVLLARAGQRKLGAAPAAPSALASRASHHALVRLAAAGARSHIVDPGAQASLHTQQAPLTVAVTHMCYCQGCPMPTTTLRVPEELKERVADLARRTGKTTHAFMLEAIEESVRMAEARQAMLDEARERFQEVEATGRAIDWHEMRAFLKDRAAGRKAASPRTRSWRR